MKDNYLGKPLTKKQKEIAAGVAARETPTWDDLVQGGFAAPAKSGFKVTTKPVAPATDRSVSLPDLRAGLKAPTVLETDVDRDKRTGADFWKKLDKTRTSPVPVGVSTLQGMTEAKLKDNAGKLIPDIDARIAEKEKEYAATYDLDAERGYKDHAAREKIMAEITELKATRNRYVQGSATTSEADKAKAAAYTASWEHGQAAAAPSPVTGRLELADETKPGDPKVKQAADKAHDKARTAGLYDYIKKTDARVARETAGEGTYKDTFGDQFQANQLLGRLGQDSSEAWSTWLDNPTEANYRHAKMIDALVEEFTQLQEKALDDENVKVGILSKDLARYLPQLVDQTKATVPAVAAGAVVGTALGNPALGIKAGMVAGSGMYSYRTMRGAAFKTLIDLGIDEDTARAAATNEALISALIEMGDTAFDLLLLGGGKLLTLATKGTVKGVTAKAAPAVLKKIVKTFAAYGINILQEGEEEASQQAVSIANARRAAMGQTGIGGLALESGKVYLDFWKGKLTEAEAAEIAESRGGGQRLAILMGLRTFVYSSVEPAVDMYNRKAIEKSVRALDADGQVEALQHDILAAVAPDSRSAQLAMEAIAEINKTQKPLKPKVFVEIAYQAQADVRAGRLAKSSNVREAQFGQTQLDNPEAVVLDDIGVELSSLASMDAETLQTQSGLLGAILAGETLTDEQMAKLDVTNPAVQQVFTQHTGLAVEKAIQNDRAALVTLFEQGSELVAETRIQQADLNRATHTIVEQQRVAAEQQQSATTEAPVAQGATPTAPGVETADAPPAAQGGVQAPTQGGADIARFKDGTTATREQIIAGYLKRHPDRTPAEASRFFDDLKQLNALGMDAGESANTLTGDSPVSIVEKKAKSAPKSKTAAPVAKPTPAPMQKTTSAGLGLRNGATDDVVHRINPEAMSPSQKRVHSWLTSRGYKNIYLFRDDYMHDTNGNIVRGYIDGDSVWLRADDRKAPLWSLARHEDGHYRLNKLRDILERSIDDGGEQGQILSGGRADAEQIDTGTAEGSGRLPGTSVRGGVWSQEVDARINAFLRENLNEEQYRAFLRAYHDKYKDVIDGQSDARKRAVLNEEIFVDALGKIDSYGVKASELHDAATQLLADIERRVALIGVMQKATASTQREGRASMADSPNGPAPIFYSKLEQVVGAFPGSRMGVSSLVSFLKGRGVKDEEIKWSGLLTAFEGQKSVTKEEILQYAREHAVHLQEVVVYGGRPEGEATYDAKLAEAQAEFGPLQKRIAKALSKSRTSWLTDLEEFVYPIDAESTVQELYDVIIDDIPEELPPAFRAEIKPELKRLAKSLHGLGLLSAANGVVEAKYEEYTLAGQAGPDYREYIYTVPKKPKRGAGYDHWKRKDVVVHARADKYVTPSGKPVFLLEEVQSDWHTTGAKKGYLAQKELPVKGTEKVSDAPYRTTWHEFVLKNMLRKAAEDGSDYLAWTTAKMQEERWSPEYAEAYRILYGQNIPSFLSKYGKQWGAKLETIEIVRSDKSFTVPAITIPAQMKADLINVGQPRYSLADEPTSYSSLTEHPNGKAPVFYSKLEQVVSSFKAPKMGVSSLEAYLKGKGVKDEEIKWSGLLTAFEGQKSVAKEDVLRFARENAVKIVELENTEADQDAVIAAEGEMFYAYDDLDTLIRQANAEAAGAYEDFEEIELDDYPGLENDARHYTDGATEDEIYESVMREVPGAISDGLFMDISAAVTRFAEAGAEFNQVWDAGTRWKEFTLAEMESSNYREYLYAIPGADNQGATDRHWGRRDVLVHARVDDQETIDGDRVFFVEEVQSDWHQQGASKGYSSEAEKAKLEKERTAILAEFDTGLLKTVAEKTAHLFSDNPRYARNNVITNRDFVALYGSELSPEEITAVNVIQGRMDTWNRRNNDVRFGNFLPDAPYRTTWHEFVLKNMLRKAAEEDYAYLGWTTAQMQVERWSEKYAESYRILYDQNIPKFLNKYGKQWGVKVESIEFVNAATGEVHTTQAIPITAQMKEDLIYTGQPRYSLADTEEQGRRVSADDFIEYHAKPQLLAVQGDMRLAYELLEGSSADKQNLLERLVEVGYAPTSTAAELYDLAVKAENTVALMAEFAQDAQLALTSFGDVELYREVLANLAKNIYKAKDGDVFVGGDDRFDYAGETSNTEQTGDQLSRGADQTGSLEAGRALRGYAGSETRNSPMQETRLERRADRRVDVAARVIPTQTRAVMDERGFSNAQLTETQDGAAFAQALDAAKGANIYGALVDSHSAEDLADHKMFLAENRMSGVAVAPDGNITAVFNHSANPIRGTVRDLLVSAIANGGNKLDCYTLYTGNDLLHKYVQLGFQPVAWLRFNREYAPEGWDYAKFGEPDVVFFVHNGESSEVVARNAELYPEYTKEQVHALPEFSDYMEAWEYRDSILAQRNDKAIRTYNAISAFSMADEDVAGRILDAKTLANPYLLRVDDNPQNRVKLFFHGRRSFGFKQFDRSKLDVRSAEKLAGKPADLPVTGAIYLTDNPWVAASYFLNSGLKLDKGILRQALAVDKEINRAEQKLYAELDRLFGEDWNAETYMDDFVELAFENGWSLTSSALPKLQREVAALKDKRNVLYNQYLLSSPLIRHSENTKPKPAAPKTGAEALTWLVENGVIASEDDVEVVSLREFLKVVPEITSKQTEALSRVLENLNRSIEANPTLQSILDGTSALNPNFQAYFTAAMRRLEEATQPGLSLKKLVSAIQNARVAVHNLNNAAEALKNDLSDGKAFIDSGAYLVQPIINNALTPLTESERLTYPWLNLSWTLQSQPENVVYYRDNLGEICCFPTADAFKNDVLTRWQADTDPGIYHMYTALKNPYIVNRGGAPTNWNAFDDPLGTSTREIEINAEAAGYDGVIYENVIDVGAFGIPEDGVPDDYQEFDKDFTQVSTIVAVFNESSLIPTEGRAHFSLADTGYEDGSIQDRVLKILRASDEATAMAELESWFNTISTQTDPDIMPEERTLLSRVFQQRPGTNEAAFTRADLDKLIQTFGTLPEGEKKKRDLALPAKTAPNSFMRKHLQTALEAGTTPEVAVPFIDRMALRDEAATYARIHDTAAISYAEDQMKRRGYSKLLSEWAGLASSEHTPTKHDIAVGELLWVEAAKVGDMDTAMRVLADVAAMGTQAGQTVQAMSLLKKMTPSGQLYYLQKAVDRLNSQHKTRIANGKMNAITLNPDLARAVLEARTIEELGTAVEALLQDVADQTPVTFMDKWNTWRYLSMLGNPRTHIRNMFGNTIFMPARFLKDLTAAGLETMFLDADQRTKSATQMFDRGSVYRQFADGDFAAVRDELVSTGKYNPADMIRDKRLIYKSKALGWLNTVSKFNYDMLEWEDGLALKPAYVSALSQYLGVRKADLSTLSTTREGKKLLNEARAYAMREAQKATYRDFSAAATALNKLKRIPGFGSVIVEGVMPFTKTPINILKRGVEYSPLGLLKSLTLGAAQLKAGKITAAEFIDSVAAGATGTIVTALGVFLANLGMLQGGDDEDKKKAAFDKLQGLQNYSITVGGVNFTIDWMAPVSLPLFVGVEFQRQLADGKLTGGELLEAMTLVAEPLFSLSMLDGLNKTLKSAGYSENPLSTAAMNAVAGYFGQAVPTLFGQGARTGAKDRRMTYIDKNSKAPEFLNRFFQSNVAAKIPGLNNQRASYIDEWGRKDTTQSAFLRGFENFLSPGYIGVTGTSDMELELQRLAKTLSDTDVLPASAQKYFTVDKVRRDLTQEEYEEYATLRGKTAYQLLTDLVLDQGYQSLTDKEKAIAVKNIYEYATQTAKQAVVPEYEMDRWVASAQTMTGADVLDTAVLRTLGKINEDAPVEENILAMGWLSDEETGALLNATYYADKKFTDPSRSGYEYTLSAEQQSRQIELYNEQFDAAYSKLTASTKWSNADQEKRLALIKAMQSEARAATRKALARELQRAGIRPTKK